MGLEPLELGEQLIEHGHLVCTDGAPIGWIEDERDRVPAELMERDCLVGGSSQREIWSSCSRLQRLVGITHGCEFLPSTRGRVWLLREATERSDRGVRLISQHRKSVLM